jgi:hypothetical protein
LNTDLIDLEYFYEEKKLNEPKQENILIEESQMDSLLDDENDIG